MKAFLSHSSADRGIVDQVFLGLGAARSIYDSESFEEGRRSADEILRGLAATDIFVLFLSRSSLSSTYVTNELKFALETIFSGRIKSVLVFALDESTYQDLPAPFHSYTVDRTNKPAQIVRRIRSRLIDLQLEQGEIVDIFIGRDDELRLLQRALALPTAEMQSAISIAGWEGIGRRTFARRAIQMVFPYLKREQPLLTLADHDSIEDLHRKLLDVTIGVATTSEIWLSATAAFQAATYSERIDALVDLIQTASRAKEIVYIVGDGGVIQGNGDFHAHLRDIIKKLPKTPRPSLVLVHRRRLPPSKQLSYPEIFFTSLSSFSDDEATQLLSAHLKQHDVSFTRDDLRDLLSFVGGHPENIRIAAQYVRHYGVAQLRQEKTEFTDILVFRTIEILRRIDVNDLSKAICTVLLDYQYLQIEDFVTCFDAADKDISLQLRYLEDNGVLERTGQYYRISPYLVDAVDRMGFAGKLQDLRAKVGARMLRTIAEVSDFDNVSLSLINAATLAAIRSKRLSHDGLLAQLLLPSHLLTIAREQYNSQRYAEACALCREALINKVRLTEDAQIEAYRLLAISCLRLKDRAGFDAALKELQKYRGKIAKRNYFFLLGFRDRLDGFIDSAEQNYRQAYGIDRRHFHVLRELAHVLCLEGRYTEAERFARSAYEIAPTNAFIIDVFCEVLIGKMTAAELRVNTEIQKLLHELEVMGTDQGRSFYEEKTALLLAKTGDLNEAWTHANNAVIRAPNHWGPRLTRIILAKAMRNNASAREDQKTLDAMKDRFGDRGYVFVLDRVRISAALDSGNVSEAKEILQQAAHLPRFLREEFERRITTIGGTGRGRR